MNKYSLLKDRVKENIEEFKEYPLRAFIERVDKNTSAIRLMKVDFSNSLKIVEHRFVVSRKDIKHLVYNVYISDGNEITDVVENELEGLCLDFDDDSKYMLTEIPELSEYEGTMLEFHMDSIIQFNENNRAITLLYMMYNPWFEKVIKTGFGHTFSKLLVSDVKKTRTQRLNIQNGVEELFGHFNRNAKKVHQMFGLNPYQVERIVDFLNVESSFTLKGTDDVITYFDPMRAMVVKAMKVCFDPTSFELVDGGEVYNFDNLESIAHIDKNSFDRLFDAMIEVFEKSEFNRSIEFTPNHLGFTHFFLLVHSIWGLNEAVRSLPSIMSISDYPRGEGYRTMYHDFIVMVAMTETTELFTPDVESHVDLTERHNRVADLLTAQQLDRIRSKATRDRLGVMKTDEGIRLQHHLWERYLYENDKYLIKFPKNSFEIVSEGETLRHCVAGYTNRVSNGNTTILFIRKKEEENKPFYTVEIKGDNIVQIKGFANSYMNKTEGLTEFVFEWIQERNLNLVSQ